MKSGKKRSLFKFHPYSRKAKRQGRKPTEIVFKTMNVDAETQTEKSSKKGSYKYAQAQLIPGIDGITRFGFPNQIITKLRYCEILNTTSTSGARGGNIWRANGIFDPDVTGVGHQPMFRDSYAALYNHYRVLGSKIRVTYVSNAGNESTDGPWVCCLLGGDDATFPSVPQTSMESNDSQWAILPADKGETVTLEMTFDPASNLGQEGEHDDQEGAVGGDPGEQYYFDSCFYDAAGNTSNVFMFVELFYTVKFYELQSQAQN